MIQGTDDVRVTITGDIAGLDGAMKTAATSVEGAVQRMSSSTRRAAGNINASLGEVEQGGERLAKRFEHVGVSIAFAATALAEGSERGLARAAHAVAALGFAFGPVIGAVTTASAIIVEQFVSAMSKAEEQAKATTEKVEDMYRAIGEGGSLAAAAKRAQQLFSGDKFVARDDPFANDIRGGGILALQAQIAPLQAKLNEVQAKITALGEPGSGTFDIDTFAKLQAEATKYSESLAPLNARVQALSEAHREVIDLVDEFAKRDVAQQGARAKIAGDEKDRTQEITDAIQAQNDANAERKRLYDEQTDAALRGLADILAAEEKAEAEATKFNESFAKSQNAAEEASKRLAKEYREEWEQTFAKVSHSLGAAIDYASTKAGFLRELWRSVWYDMVRASANFAAQEVAVWAAKELVKRGITRKTVAENVAAETWGAIQTIAIKTWEAIKWIALHAAKAAAAAWSALAGIPIIGPALGIAAAAATFAGVMALARGIGGGGGAPGGSGAAAAAGANAASAQRSASSTVVHVNAVDAKSFHDMAMNNRATFTKVISKVVREGGLTPKKLGIA